MQAISEGYSLPQKRSRQCKFLKIRKRKKTGTESESKEYVEYEDTHPDEYAEPVYRGNFWLFSLELAKATKVTCSVDRNSSSSPGYLSSSDRLESCSQWSDDQPLPAVNSGFSNLETPRLPPRLKTDEERDFNVQDPSQLKKNSKKFADYTSSITVPTIPITTSRTRKKEKKVVMLYCNHCEKAFKAKPTFRPKFMHFLVNHACSGVKRHQYVVGVKHRKCPFDCDATLGCICLEARRLSAGTSLS